MLTRAAECGLTGRVHTLGLSSETLASLKGGCGGALGIWKQEGQKFK